MFLFFFFKQKTAYDMRISDWSSDVCSSDLQPDVLQEVYGVPEWLAALQAGLLNENATLFRRRYYLNGAHAGFVFYLSEALADQETKDNLKDQLKNAKGRGNFKNLFVNIPNGKKDGIQIMPLSEDRQSVV